MTACLALDNNLAGGLNKDRLEEAQTGVKQRCNGASIY